jgi:hypothetical protein
MKKLLVVAMVGVLLFAALVQGTSASDVCRTESVSCLEVDRLDTEAAARQRATQADSARYTEMAAQFPSTQPSAMRADGLRLTGMAAYYSARAAYGPRALSARYQALADYYAGLRRDAGTLSTARGLGALYGR